MAVSVKYGNRKTVVDGITPKRKSWTPADDALLCRLREEGLSYTAIAKRLGRSAMSVQVRGGRLIKRGVAPKEVRGRVIEDPVAHFWARVDNSAGSDVCWPWVGARYGAESYGAVVFDLGDGPKVVGAHRVAFLLSGGELTDENPFVLHSCDNKQCCNPAHLSAGTHSENMKQAHARGLMPVRDVSGENHPGAMLDEKKVREIRHRASLGEPRAALAKAFGLSKSGMDHVVAGRTWAQVK